MVVKIHNLPVIVVNGLGASLVVTLGLAYYYEHITYVVPYISDSGTYPPESCIFAQVLNIISVLIGFALYIRYLQIETQLNGVNPKIKKFNKINFYIGLSAAIGVSIVANFQETNNLIVHWIGAVLAFGGGSLYQVTQAFIASKERHIFGNNLIRKTQYVLAVLSPISFIIFFVTGMNSLVYFNGTDITKWKPEDGAFEMHLTSTITEWICASSIMIFMFLLKWEFQRIQVRGIKVLSKPSSVTSREI